MNRGEGPKRRTGLNPVSKKRAASGEPPLKRGGPMRQISEKKAAEGRTSSSFGTPRAPLPRGESTLRRTGPLPQRNEERAARPPRPPKLTAPILPPKGETFPPAVRRLLFARCGGMCEKCGWPLDEPWHAHHRQRRREGDHSLDNGVALHPLCHILADQAVHQRPTESKRRGLIVRPEADPRAAPLILPTGLIVYLHPVEPRYLDVIHGG